MRLDIDPRLPMGGKITIQQSYAAELFRAMNGDKNAQEFITLADVEGLHNAETLEQFIKVNNMVTFEEVSR